MATKQDLEISEQDIQAHKEWSRGVMGTSDSPEAKEAPAMGTLQRSPSIAQLTKALCAACLEFPEITKDTENPYFKSQYTDLATLIKSTRPVLAKHGLYVLQLPQVSENRVIVTTLLTHTSGEWLANDLAMPMSKPDAQGTGSAITYARRYSYQSILNIAGEEDDDGNAATGRTQADYRSKSTDDTPGRVNPVQVRAFWSACETGKKTKAQSLQYLGNMGYETAEELNKHELDAAIKWALAK